MSVANGRGQLLSHPNLLTHQTLTLNARPPSPFLLESFSNFSSPSFLSLVMSSHEIRMASRAALMQRLANLSTEGVCALLDDERILDAASAYFARADEAEGQQAPALSPPDTLPPSPITPSAASSVPPAFEPGNKRTRPVNAFVAFRSKFCFASFRPHWALILHQATT